MEESRIAQLLTPFLYANGSEDQRGDVLSPKQLEDISTYIDLLLKWNARFNLTAVRDPEQIVTRHFGESLFTARHLFPKSEVQSEMGQPRSNEHVIDVGSGAGFPGLPIKLWAPLVRLTLIESNQKKATFLREVVRRLRLDGVDVFVGRAEGFPGDKGDVVTFRAVEHFELIVKVAAGMVASAGRLAILAGKPQLSGIYDRLPGLKWDKSHAFPLSASRALIIGRNEPSLASCL
jgi:16S rRNA (guanine527-N7)-methyltransferase